MKLQLDTDQGSQTKHVGLPVKKWIHYLERQKHQIFERPALLFRCTISSRQ